VALEVPFAGRAEYPLNSVPILDEFQQMICGVEAQGGALN